MQFPALIKEEMLEELKPVQITDPLTLAIKTKFQSLKKKQQTKYKFTKNYLILDFEIFNQHKEKFLAYLKDVKEGQTQGIQEFYPLIFGVLEGTSSNIDPTKILLKYFGHDIDKLQLLELIKEKTKSINYGNDKRRDSNIRQVSDKKIFQSISIFIDLKQIRAHRKMCNNVKNYIKALKKFKDCIENSIQESNTTIFTQDSEQNKSYMQFVTQQLNFNKLKLPNQFLYQQEDIIEEKQQIVQKPQKSQSKPLNGLQKFLTITPLKQIQVQNNQKLIKSAQTSQPKSQDIDKKQNDAKFDMQQQNNDQKGMMQDKQAKIKKPKRTKEQIERDRIAKQKQRQQKRKQQERKKLQKIAKQNQLLKQKQQKQRQKQMQRIAKQKEKEAKQRQKQQKQRQRQAQKQAKQAERLVKQKQRQAKEEERLAKQAQRLAKQAQKMALIKAKQEKQNRQKAMMKKFFIKKSVLQSPQKKMQIQQIEEIKPIKEEFDQKQQFLSLIKSQITDISVCLSEFKINKMKDQACAFEPYYTNVITNKSRLQFKNFKVNEKRFDYYFQPHFQAQVCKYDDSSVEYQDICGDICNEQMDLMSAEDEEGSFNSAIVNDSYVSQEQLSSLQDQRNHVIIKISQGVQWYFSDPSHKYAEQYTMFGLYDEQILPLKLHQEQQSNEPTINLKCQLYKQIHGYFGPKQPLIKKMASIADKISKNSLDTMIKQTTTKKGNQRLVKPQIIDFLNEQKQGFAKQLQEIKMKRDLQNRAEMNDKITEKQRQIQRLILNEAGTYYIIDLLQFLKEKGYRMRKRDLQQFIDIRSGSQWDDIRRRMKKMNLKEKQKINKYFKKDKDGRQIKQEKENKQDQENALIYQQNVMQPICQNMMKNEQNAMNPECQNTIKQQLQDKQLLNENKVKLEDQNAMKPQ